MRLVEGLGDPQPSSGKCGDAGKAHTRGGGVERVVQRGASALSGTRAAARRARSGRAARHARNAVGRPRKATDPGDGSALTAHGGTDQRGPGGVTGAAHGNLAPSEKKLDRKGARMRLPRRTRPARCAAECPHHAERVALRGP
ncbi:hypothetical protein IscW_ISCW022191 [Ixodes scapularis]|uniref:Uncharacterized protein n=1 Tax=Ixodes scapularis TaxID=6945 RepID=B7QDG8_IXOSC|nr:hypothetical protein IscW_ISCW022191 [Ixodes scapularis]|eukprot:XP_002413582.1 hypothetical protein IscW_ISCW022191 [Ixodes scapularis]